MKLYCHNFDKKISLFLLKYFVNWTYNFYQMKKSCVDYLSFTIKTKSDFKAMYLSFAFFLSCVIAPEGSFVVSAAKGRRDIIAKFVFFYFFLLFFSVFPDFPVSRKVLKPELLL